MNAPDAPEGIENTFKKIKPDISVPILRHSNMYRQIIRASCDLFTFNRRLIICNLIFLYENN